MARLQGAIVGSGAPFPGFVPLRPTVDRPIVQKANGDRPAGAAAKRPCKWSVRKFSCALCRIEAVRRPPTIPATKNSGAHSDPFGRVVAQFLRIVACPFRNPRQRVRLPVRAAQSPQIDAIDAPSDDLSIGGAW